MSKFKLHPLDGEVAMIRFVHLHGPSCSIRLKAEPEAVRIVSDLLAAQPTPVDDHYTNIKGNDQWRRQWAEIEDGSWSLTYYNWPAEDIWQRRADEGRDPETGEPLPPPAEEPVAEEKAG